MSKKAILTEKVQTPRGFYSQGVASGDLVFISGQLPLNEKGELVGTTIEEQTQQTLKNVEAILEKAGGSLQDLVSVTTYLVDGKLWPGFDAAYRQYLAKVEILPARAAVPVTGLNYGALIEIQAVARCSGKS